MSRTRKIVIMIALVITPAAVGAAWFLLANPDSAGRFMKWQVERGQVRLFCEADHKALSEACRELSRRVASGELEAGSYQVGWFPERTASCFPKPILALRPREVILSEDGTVDLSMYTGWRPFGVWACPEGYEGQRPDDARRRLLDGLWYYDNEYTHYGDAVDRAINALIETHSK